MAHFKDAALAHELKRWMRPDAHRFVRPDWRRFVRPGFEKDHPFALYERKYRPDQLRDELGRWADEGSGGRWSKPSGINDPRVISDATPDNDWKPGAQYAQNRQTPPVTAVLINGNWVVPTPGQAARLTIVEAQARDAIRRVQELDPRWKPQAELYDTIEGRIAARQNDLRQAQDRTRELQDKGIGPGRYAGESIPARGSERDFTAAERREINRIGSETGCHTCGTRNPGALYDNYVIDHQIPTRLNLRDAEQRLYPQCLLCSLRQGGAVRQLTR
jgi:hypothetical protein